MARVEGSSPLPLKRVELRNFRCFESFEWSGIDPRFNVIVAPNGGGKTALLDAIAVGLAPFPRLRTKTIGWNIADWDVRRIAPDGGGTLRASADVQVMIDGGDPTLAWQVSRATSESSKTRTSQAVELTEAAQKAFAARADGWPLPVIAYYGTARLWGHQSLTRKRLGREIEDGYLDCLDPRASFRAFEEWVGAVAQDRHNEGSGTAARRQWEFLVWVLEQTLRPAGLKDFEYSATWQALLARSGDGPFLPVNWQSDGTRTLLGLVGDVARRICLLNGDIDGFDLRKTTGIVMVDEVDLHLHPAWQQQVVQALRQAFPRVQWIVTTHSQQVVSTVPRERVWEFHGEPESPHLENPQMQTEGEASSAVLASVFDVDPLPPSEWRDKLGLLDDRVDAPDSRELERLLEELRDHFGPTYPALRQWEARRRHRQRGV